MAGGIGRKTPIGELVLNHPVAAAVLLEHGFHCIGCQLAAYETLEEGAAAHGFDDAQIDALVGKIRDAAAREEEIIKKEGKTPAAKEEKGKKPAKKSKPGQSR